MYGIGKDDFLGDVEVDVEVPGPGRSKGLGISLRSRGSAGLGAGDGEKGTEGRGNRSGDRSSGGIKGRGELDFCCFDTIEGMLVEMVRRGGSDLHLSIGKYPYIRLGEGLEVLCKLKIDRVFFERMLQRVMKSEGAFARLFEKEEVDTTFECSVGGRVYRFRVNIGLARGEPFAVFRELRGNIPEPHLLGIPEEFIRVAEEVSYGLIILGGPTGSGKSTTMASCLNYILKKYPEKVITIEDPIEYLIGDFPGCKGYVVQREVGRDTKSFAAALRAAMRQDPDYIVVGEVRDVETARYCVIAAETGHVVFTTLHISSVLSVTGRFAGMFGIEEQNYIKRRMLDQLKAVQVQMLVPGVDGKRKLATELLIVNDKVREMLFEGRVEDVKELLKKGRCGWTMERSLRRLLEKGEISREVYEDYSGVAG